MTRRSTSQKKIDESAFPIRVKFRTPASGFGARLDDLHNWLSEEIGQGEYAVHSSGGLAMDALGVYLRDLECARAIVDTFPDLSLADGTQSIVYSSPAQSGLWHGWELFGMCNLYDSATPAELMAQLDQAWRDDVKFLRNDTQIYPDYMAPVGRIDADGKVMTMMRWGMPSPAFALKGKKTDRGVTNVRNTKSPHWRRWLGVEHRCIVPFRRFAEPDQKTKKPVWFAPDQDIAYFAGIWTQWTSVRKLKDGETTDNLFGFLTTDANADVGAVHPKAMPVVLTTRDEIDTWLGADVGEALQLQRPLLDGMLREVVP